MLSLLIALQAAGRQVSIVTTDGGLVDGPIVATGREHVTIRETMATTHVAIAHITRVYTQED